MNHSSHYNPQHRHILRLLFALVLSCVVVPSMAQVGEEAALKMSDVDMDSPTFRPTVHTGKALVDGDSVQYVKTNNVYVFPKIEFKTPEERAKFYRLLYNIKKVLPIAKECHQIVIETYEGGIHYTEDGGESWTDLPGETPVSMNLWGFGESFVKEADRRFARWLDENLEKNPLKCEYFLPLVVTELIEEGKAKIRVLRSTDKWYGVTSHIDETLWIFSDEGASLTPPQTKMSD